MRSDPMNPSAALAALRRAVPWLIALAGFAFDIAAFWPGQMSFDSAYAWWQARGGTTTDIVPPLFVWVWRIGNLLVDGPGAVFALHLALFWCGLALLVRALRCAPFTAIAVMLVVALAPVSLVLRGHVWTDVGLFSALTFAAGALACAQVDRRRRWLLPAASALFYAAALRHNALPAIVPFAAWFAWLSLRDVAAAGATRIALMSVVLLIALAGLGRWLDAGVDRHVPVWPSLAQWDLAAVSIATDRLRLPDFMIGPGLDVAELAGAFRSWSNTPMLANARHGIRDPFADYSAQELATLRSAWLNAITGEPRAWLAHRARLSRALFGTHPGDWPRELVYVDDEFHYQDNPPVLRNAGTLHARVMRVAASLAATPALAAWPCLVLGAIGGILAVRRRGDTAARVVAITLLSAWLYALPLCVLAPAAELRYLGWPCVASLLAFACAAFAPRSVPRC
jgi:hypothetical protein